MKPEQEAIKDRHAENKKELLEKEEIWLLQ